MTIYASGDVPLVGGSLCQLEPHSESHKTAEQTPEKPMPLKARWMVVGSGAPTVWHYSEGAACCEAIRLAKLLPGESFTVLRAVRQFATRTVMFPVEEFDQSSDDIPWNELQNEIPF